MVSGIANKLGTKLNKKEADDVSDQESNESYEFVYENGEYINKKSQKKKNSPLKKNEQNMDRYKTKQVEKSKHNQQMLTINTGDNESMANEFDQLIRIQNRNDIAPLS